MKIIIERFDQINLNSDDWNIEALNNDKGEIRYTAKTSTRMSIRRGKNEHYYNCGKETILYCFGDMVHAHITE
ncbi:hypothetical protein FJZ31_21220 [Candidatus Poribacteria bacterium]|nr:hypothetical protein [Candidatus Poribacteria bacterium]